MATMDFFRHPGDDVRQLEGPDLSALREENARSLSGKRDSPLLCRECGEGLPFHRVSCASGGLS